MINILTETMPERVTVDGKSYRINTDFRIWIKAIQLMDKYSADICALLLAPICYADIPENSDTALKGIIAFLNPNRENGNKKEKKIIDFEKDASYIFSAFYSQYGIDLSVEKMHYYKFCALLWGLSGDHMLLKLISIRTTELSEIKDSELRKKYAGLKKTFGLDCENAEPGECIFNIIKGGEDIGKKENR